MNKKKNKKHSFKDRDRKRNKSNSFKNYKNDEDIKTKYGNDIKVVSTNIVKENKEIEIKNKNINSNINNKNNYQTIKKEEFNRSNYNKSNNKRYQGNTSDIKRRALIQKEIKSYQINLSQEKKECSKCNKRIDYISNSIYDKKKDEYYHFDCVLTEIKKDMLIKSNQRVVYLGSGTFGLIENSNDSGSSKFIIKKKIQYIQDQAVS